MSNEQKTQTKPLAVTLSDAKDCASKKSYIISKLQQQNCKWVIIERPTPNLESVKATLILDGFAQADLRPSTLLSALRDEKEDHLDDSGKSSGTIKDQLIALPVTPRKNATRNVGDPRDPIPAHLPNGN